MNKPPGNQPPVPNRNLSQENRRQHFRVRMTQPVEVMMIVNGAKLPILLIDLSAGGMRYVSDVKFPVNEIYTYDIEINLLNNKVSITGQVIRCVNVPGGLFDYGFIFNTDQKEQVSAVYQLSNELNIFIRKNPQYSSFTYPVIQRMYQIFQNAQNRPPGMPPVK